MKPNKRYFIGSVKKYRKGKGWFFGHFMDQPLLRSRAVEVAWQDVSGKKSNPTDRHYHRSSIEINVVISGRLRLSVNGNTKTVKAGEFLVVYPKTVVSDVTASAHTEVIVVRAPSLPNDKKNLRSE